MRKSSVSSFAVVASMLGGGIVVCELCRRYFISAKKPKDFPVYIDEDGNLDPNQTYSLHNGDTLTITLDSKCKFDIVFELEVIDLSPPGYRSKPISLSPGQSAKVAPYSKHHKVTLFHIVECTPMGTFRSRGHCDGCLVVDVS